MIRGAKFLPTLDVDDVQGWFGDSTPSDNFEFLHTANATGTDLFTDLTNTAAGHLDLSTALSHEMGNAPGPVDSTSAGDAAGPTHINPAGGVRQTPDATDAAQADISTSTASDQSATPSGALTFAFGNPGNDTIDVGKGGGIVFGGAEQTPSCSPASTSRRSHLRRSRTSWTTASPRATSSTSRHRRRSSMRQPSTTH